MQAQFASPREITSELAEIVKAPRRLLPSEAAVFYGLRDKEGHPWTADVAPYMVEPMDLLAGRKYQSIVFVGPARTSKSFSLVHGAMNYIVTCDPGDTSLVQMTHDTARSFSCEEIAPVIRNSPGLRDRLTGSDNIFDKQFISGMTFSLAWPAVSKLSSVTRKYMIVTDYDRPQNRDNVDGEGPLYDLAVKRVTTYMSRGKVIVESSPGEDYIDAAWTQKHPHEAPPALGIADLYNRGTRARFYWKCMECDNRIQAAPGPEIFKLPEFKILQEMLRDESAIPDMVSEYARVVCPACGTQHFMQHRRELNLGGKWLHEGERFSETGLIVGARRDVAIASYWLGGTAAAFQRWDGMLRGYFEAIRSYLQTGDEGPMRTKTNTDFGASYLPRAAAARRKAEDLINRAEDWQRGLVPKGVRFLTAAVDIQNNRFVVQVHGWGEELETWLVDRFEISVSKRMENGAFEYTNPAVYDEDWDLLTEQVLNARYQLEEDHNLSMPVYVTALDSGGAAGVHTRAFDYYRRLRAIGRAHELKLVKGANTDTAPRFAEHWPDARTKTDRNTPSRGDVPVWFLNTSTYKDAIVGDLSIDRFGRRYVHLPAWLAKSAFSEYVAETKTLKGWEKNAKRNESFDLHVYNLALVSIIGAETIKDWSAAPSWARRPVACDTTSRAMMASGATIGQRMAAVVAAPAGGANDIRSRMAALAVR